MKYLIVGLGNIGEEYYGTRHNIGFRVVNRLAEEMSVSFKDMRYGAIAKGRVKNAELILLKPSTYMNLSGNALRYWMQEENIPLERVLVVVDDLALDLGVIRLKAKGSDAGHNGLKNIASVLSTQNYARLRFGIGKDFPKGAQVDFVLGKFSEEEEKILVDKVDKAKDAVISFALQGLSRTMNQFNS